MHLYFASRTFSKFRLFSIRKISTVGKIKGRVLVSSSNDIFTNLAFEDWLYRNSEFSNEHVLLLWRNKPCVVIGRHQNPWAECNTEYLPKVNAVLARRNSGGGTVYHDLGNLNCTFFTSRKSYNRKRNLQMICDAIQRRWRTDLRINKRDDILLENKYKISGTAAKLGSPNAYHHCTVLFDVQKENLQKLLYKNNNGMEHKATASVRGEVKNLCESASTITYLSLIEALTEDFFCEYEGEEKWEIVNPIESKFPGLQTIKEQFSNWKWIYGRTPKFVLKRQFVVPTTVDEEDVHVIEDCQEQLDFTNNGHRSQVIKVMLQVHQGRIETLQVFPLEFLPNYASEKLQESLKNICFKIDDFNSALHNIINSCDPLFSHRKIQFVIKCLQNIIKQV